MSDEQTPLVRWAAWATGRISERMRQAQQYLDMDCRALAEEEIFAGRAMLELMQEFQRMVLDDGRTDQERTGPEDT